MPAVTIDDVIALAPSDIAIVSYGGVKSLFVQTQSWINGLFLETGIFPPSQDEQRNPGQRPVSDWYGAHLMARDTIEGPGVGQSGVVGTANVIGVVERVAYAVKYAVIDGLITAAQQTAVIALYNATWE